MCINTYNKAHKRPCSNVDGGGMEQWQCLINLIRISCKLGLRGRRVLTVSSSTVGCWRLHMVDVNGMWHNICRMNGERATGRDTAGEQKEGITVISCD